MKTQTRTAAVVALDGLSAIDVEVAGGKAATLARLAQDGFPVPAGFVLTASACDRSLSSVSGDERAATDEIPVPVDLQESIAAALGTLDRGPVAVRSSAVAEDQSGASFAGQYGTVLDVEGPDAVIDAVRAVLASAHSAHLATYREASGRDDPRLAVLVQRLVPAEAAGVAFSANPVTGARDETLVSAVRGLGERLVSGESTPDEFVVRDGDVETVARPEDAIDAVWAREIAALADRLEAHIGRPQDVEWALADGELFLLQSRPITALPVPPKIDLPAGTWSKDTSHYPEPISPLGASAYLPALDDAVETMCREWGLVVERVEQRSVGGEVYAHVVPLGGKEGGPTPPWWLLGLLSRILPPLRRRMKTARRQIDSGALERLPRKWEEDWRPALRRRIDELREVDLASLDDTDLAAHLDRTEELLHEGQRIHFRLFIPYAVGMHELAEAADDLLGWTAGEAMNLLQGLSTASSEPARALHELAQLVRDHPGTREVVEQAGDELLERLEEMDPEVAAGVRTYRDEWGLRTVNYDPGSPTLRERPALLGQLLRDALHELDRSPGDGLDDLREEARARACEQLEARAASVADRERFERALEYATRVYPLREDNIFWTDNVPSALLRLTALEAGRRLAERGALAKARDVVWLEIGELRDLLAGAHRDDVAERVERRKGERRYVRANPGPAVIGPEPSPPPDVRGLPEAGRRMNGALLWLMQLEGYQPSADGDAHDVDLAGVPASAGTHTGPVRVVTAEHEFDRVRPGDVLVCPITTPAWSVLFGQAGAVVTDGGGVLSHAAIVAREHGIPAVLGTGDATTRLEDGAIATVDGAAGTITIEKEHA